jgi:hypothetical protein
MYIPALVGAAELELAARLLRVSCFPPPIETLGTKLLSILTR